MFLTVTPDPVLDKVLMVERWTPGVAMRAKRSMNSVGGKGLDASVALRHLGQPTLGLAFLAGGTGQELARLVQAYGIRLEAVWAGGVTRTAYIVAESEAQRHTHLFTGGLEIEAAQREAFMQAYQTGLPEAGWVICGGTLPPRLPVDFYAALIAQALEAGKPALIDCYGAFMLEALSAHPTVVKLNRGEFEVTFAQRAGSLEELLVKGAEVYRAHALETLLITCGEEGLLAFTSQGVFHALPPRLQVVNAAGAGDAASAAVAWRRFAGDDWPQTLRWVAAASAAVVLTEGTADLRLEDVHRILPEVLVRQIP